MAKATPRVKPTQKPLTPAYPETQDSVKSWEIEAKRRRNHSMERQLINAGQRINSLCAVLRVMDSEIKDLTKRLRFLELAPKMKVGPR